jgi:hypothetical protein
MKTIDKKQLPSLQDLQLNVQEAYKQDQLNLLLNQQPPESWVKIHPFAKSKYVPIEKVEHLLTRIFGEWRVEILREGQMFNSVYVAVRLHYKNPITGEWQYHDGLGAVGVQTDKGESASNLAAIKQDAIMKALPAAESYAIKDAAEKLGDIFGKNLNRKDAIQFSMTYTPTIRKGLDLFDEALSNIASGKLPLEFYERTEIIEKMAYEELHNIQIDAIKDFCSTANLDDDLSKDYQLRYVSRYSTAEDIINEIREKYNVRYITTL